MHKWDSEGWTVAIDKFVHLFEENYGRKEKKEDEEKEKKNIHLSGPCNKIVKVFLGLVGSAHFE